MFSPGLRNVAVTSDEKNWSPSSLERAFPALRVPTSQWWDRCVWVLVLVSASQLPTVEPRMALRPTLWWTVPWPPLAASSLSRPYKPSVKPSACLRPRPRAQPQPAGELARSTTTTVSWAPSSATSLLVTNDLLLCLRVPVQATTSLWTLPLTNAPDWCKTRRQRIILKQ